jgi:hypothetical protein
MCYCWRRRTARSQAHNAASDVMGFLESIRFGQEVVSESVDINLLAQKAVSRVF